MQIPQDFSILITGGTGSFGNAFLKEILKRYPKLRRIVIFSRDELKQWEMQQKFPSKEYPNLRFFLGDIRDLGRLKIALYDIDFVIHAAALKQVPAAEYNPFEFIKTNVLGAQNLVEACLDSNVKKVIALSTDKAAAPVNLYGASKLCSDKLFIAANNISGVAKQKFTVVRYGNVMGSRGSVIPLFTKQAKEGSLKITDPEMTRFNLTLNEGVEMVLWTLLNTIGGEIFVPKIPSYRILDIAEAIAPNLPKQIVGIRPGEKIHEEMITTSDSYSTIDLDNHYAILPLDGELKEEYIKRKIAFKPFPKGKSYNSNDNGNFLTVNEIRKLLVKNIDKNFSPI